MKVPHWRLIAELRSEISKLLDRTLVGGAAAAGGADRTVARQHTRYLRDNANHTHLADVPRPVKAGMDGGSGLVERLRLGGSERSGTAVPSLAVGSAAALRSPQQAAVSPELLKRLREDLLAQIERLEERLSKDLSEADIELMLFPLVLLCDEMVMVRLAKDQHTQWHLLQTELFSINYGGDVFYEFTDEQLSKPGTAIEVFEVLYYCLISGFVGRFGFDSGKIQRYRSLLGERIAAINSRDQVAASSVPESMSIPPKRRRTARGPEEGRRAASGFNYYIAALATIFAFMFLLILITN
jgi:type VI secretion system protein ImpK